MKRTIIARFVLAELGSRQVISRTTRFHRAMAGSVDRALIADTLKLIHGR